MSSETIVYKKNAPLSLEQFIEVFRASGLADRRPVDNTAVMQNMLNNASLMITAWVDESVVGLARTLTDFGHAAYLADLAVARSHQGRHIGRRLVEETKAALNPECMLVLLAAPDANAFYPKIGFSNNPRAWVLNGDESVK